MRASSVAVLLTLCVWPAFARGQVQQFPYEAVCQADDVAVRSGPGPRYYETSHLHVGDQVIVHRHDVGGWYMIAPPEGSFSWIDAALVSKTNDTNGIVATQPLADGSAARAFVRIGSMLTDDVSVYSRELMNGDAVEIIGEQLMTTPRGQVLMYKIQPPSLEYRFVKGDFIVPASESIRREHDGDPYNVPAEQKLAGTVSLGIDDGEEMPVATFAEPVSTVDGKEQTALAAPSEQSSASGTVTDDPFLSSSAPTTPRPAPEDLAGRLEFNDRQFSDMVARDIAVWSLGDITAEYHALQGSGNADVSRIAGQRLVAVAAKQRLLDQYQEFLQLTTETDQRDAQLRAMQQSSSLPPMTTVPSIAGGASPVRLGVPQPVPDAGRPSDAARPDLYERTSTPVGGPRIAPLTPIPDAPLPSPASTQVTPRFDGAGIVQRSGAALGLAPAHVLTAPDGRRLAFLQAAPGVNIDNWVGQPVGVIGQRGFDARLGADRIVVRQLTAVRLGQ